MRLRKLVLVLAVLAMIGALASCGALLGTEEAGQKKEAPDEQVAPKQGPEENDQAVGGPEDTTLKLTVPKMERVKNAEIPTGRGDDEQLLRTNTAIHLQGTGYPWDEEANVYIAGHRLGYSGTDSYLAFYDIDKLENGDELIVEDANGKKYTYEVFKKFVVEPTALYVLNPIEGKNIVSLQACTLPDYSNRIIVQAELKA